LIRRYKGDAIEIIRDFGDDGIQLLEKYGDNAVSIFTRYGDESVNILERYGDDILHVDGTGIITVTGENAEELAREISEFTGEEVFYSVTSGTLNLPMSTKEGIQATSTLGHK
jgi:hypothetical protein